jgi:hypothetical protein
MCLARLAAPLPAFRLSLRAYAPQPRVVSETGLGSEMSAPPAAAADPVAFATCVRPSAACPAASGLCAGGPPASRPSVADPPAASPAAARPPAERTPAVVPSVPLWEPVRPAPSDTARRHSRR